MDQHEDARGLSADKAVTGPIDAKPAAATEPGAPELPKTEIASIEAPSIVPSVTEPSRPSTPRSEAEKPAAKPDAAAPKIEVAAATPDGTKPAAASPIRRACSRLGRTAPLAAAAVVGLVAGALGATALPQIRPLVFGAAPPPAETPSVTAAIAQMRADLAALKASTDATSRSTSAQLTRLSERFDRLERLQTATNKADMVVAKETTGSITPQPPSGATAPLPPVPLPPPGIVSGWVVRDVYHGAAILQGRLGGMIEVGPGDILPGVGRVEAIRRQDGRWVVITTRGMIVSMR